MPCIAFKPRVRGENVYSMEVENVIAQHPAVSQCAVIGIPSERWGETVHAFVIPNPGSNVNAAEKMAAHPSRSR